MGKEKLAVIYERRGRHAYSDRDLLQQAGKRGPEKEEGWEMDLIIRYDPEADVLVVKLREGAVADEELLDNDAVVGYDREGRVVYVEVLDASKKGLISALAELAKAARSSATPAKVNKTC